MVVGNGELKGRMLLRTELADVSEHARKKTRCSRKRTRVDWCAQGPEGVFVDTVFCARDRRKVYYTVALYSHLEGIAMVKPL
jgi:hypothetical protein